MTTPSKCNSEPSACPTPTPTCFNRYLLERIAADADEQKSTRYYDEERNTMSLLSATPAISPRAIDTNANENATMIDEHGFPIVAAEENGAHDSDAANEQEDIPILNPKRRKPAVVAARKEKAAREKEEKATTKAHEKKQKTR